MGPTLKKPMSDEELALCELALSLPITHGEDGCPSHKLYGPIAKLEMEDADSTVAKAFWNASYDDGRSCPMVSVHWLAEYCLRQDKILREA